MPASAPPARPARRPRRPAPPPPTLESRIRGCYETLPGSERRVADLLLHHPGRLALHSATELAAEVATSKAAVTRLIQRLGYDGYAQARAEVRDAQRWGSPIYLDEAGPPQGPGRRAAYAEHMAADQQALARTLGALTDADLDGAVSALATARRVVVIGFRNSSGLAMYARSLFSLLRPAVDLAPLAAETLAESLVGLGAGDLLFAIGFRRRVPALAAALRAARAASVPIALLTDPSGAADLRQVDWSLTCHCRGAAMLDTYVAATSVINFLASQLALQLGEHGRQRLLEIEQWHQTLDDLA